MSRYRNAMLQGTLQRMRVHPLLATAVERLPMEMVQHIESESARAFVPVSYDLAVAQAIAEALPPHEVIAFVSDNLAANAERKLLRNIVRSVLRLYGPSVTQAFSHVPVGFGAIYQDCGRIEVSGVPGRLVLRWVDIPECMQGHPSYFDVVGASLTAVYGFCDAVGDIERVAQPEVGVEEYVARWTPRVDEKRGLFR